MLHESTESRSGPNDSNNLLDSSLVFLFLKENLDIVSSNSVEENKERGLYLSPEYANNGKFFFTAIVPAIFGLPRQMAVDLRTAKEKFPGSDFIVESDKDWFDRTQEDLTVLKRDISYVKVSLRETNKIIFDARIDKIQPIREKIKNKIKPYSQQKQAA